MPGGKIDKRLGGIYRDKDDSTPGSGGKTISSVDNSIEIVETETNYDLSVKKSILELFASNETELLDCWDIGRDSEVSFRINVVGTITFTATRNFLIARDEPEAEIVGYPRNIFSFGNNRVNWSRVKIQNIDARTTHHTYFYAQEGYLTLQNVRFVDDVLYNADIAQMKVHVRSYDPANNNTGNIILDSISHYTQNVTWNNSGAVQPLIILNEGLLYHNLYVSLTKMDAVQSFERFSSLLLKASVSTPYKVTGDTTWRYHSTQEDPGTGFISSTSLLLKNASIDQMWVNKMPINNNSPVGFLAVDSNNKVSIYPLENMDLQLKMISGYYGNEPVDTGSGDKVFTHEVYLFEADEDTVISHFYDTADNLVTTKWEGKLLKAGKYILIGPNINKIKKVTVVSGGKGIAYFANNN